MEVIRRIRISRKELIFILLALVNTLIMLYPILRSGFIGDDALNSLISGALAENGQTLISFIIDSLKGWLRSGRFFPLSLYGYVIFFFVKNVVLYKITLVAFILVNIAVFGYFVKILTRSRSLALFSMMLPPLLFQLRLYHDALVSYNWLLQLIFLYLVGSLIFLIFYLEKGKKRFMVMSIIAYLLCILTYEITYIFSLFHFIVIYFYPRKKGLLLTTKRISPFFLTSSLAFLGIFLFRVTTGTGHPAYTLTSGAKIFLVTFLKQTVSAFPLTYYLIDPHNIFNGFYKIISYNIFASLLIIVGYVALFLIGLNILRKEFSTNKSIINLRLLIAMGIAFLILPGVLISLSPKYQAEIIWGIGYPPVYISYFGIVLLLLALISKSLARKKLRVIVTSASIATALVGGFIGAININANALVVDKINKNWLYPRNVIRKAASTGLLMNVPDESTVFVTGNYSWDKSSFFRMHSRAKLKLVSVAGSYLSAEIPPDAFKGTSQKFSMYSFSRKDNYYYLRYKADAERGYAISGKIESFLATNEELAYVALSDVRLFINSPKPKRVSFAFNYLDKGKHVTGERLIIKADDLNTISSGTNWALYRVFNTNKYIEASSIKIGWPK